MFGVCARKLCSVETRGYDKLLRSAVDKYVLSCFMRGRLYTESCTFCNIVVLYFAM